MNIVWIVINQTSSWDEPDEISIKGIFDSKSKAIDYVDSQYPYNLHIFECKTNKEGKTMSERVW